MRACFRNCLILMLCTFSIPCFGAEGPAPGRTLWVSPTSKLERAGTEADPSSLSAACRLAGPGDTVLLKAGIYRERLVPTNSGAAGAPVTFAAVPGELPIIDGSASSMGSWGGLVEIAELSFITIRGLKVEHSPAAGIAVFDSADICIESNLTEDTELPGIMAWRCSRADIRSNEVVRSCLGSGRLQAQEGISVAKTAGFTIAGNHVHHGRTEGIDAKQGSAHGLIYGNLVHDQGAIGIYVDAWDEGQSDILVYNNLVRSCKLGIAAASENGGLLEAIEIRDNEVRDNEGFGIGVCGWGQEGTRHPIKGVTIHRNRLESNGSGIAIIASRGTRIEEVDIFNNLVYWNREDGIVLTGDEAVTEPAVHSLRIYNNSIAGNGRSGGWASGGIDLFNVHSSNLSIFNNIVSDNKSYSIRIVEPELQPSLRIEFNLIDGFRSAWSETLGQKSIKRPARFVDPTRANFMLEKNSPGIDAALVEAAPSADFQALPRPQGLGPDLGAYEWIP